MNEKVFLSMPVMFLSMPVMFLSMPVMFPWNQKQGAYKVTFIAGDTWYEESTNVSEVIHIEIQ